MQTEVVLRVYNLLVHYGEDNLKNFRHLLEDGFFSLVDEVPVINSKDKFTFLENLKYKIRDNNYYLTGTFYKERSINVDHKKASDKKAVKDPIKEDVYVTAYFELDLVKHRLYWFCKREETMKPSAQSLAALIKKKTYASLRAEYIRDVKDEYKQLSKTKKAQESLAVYRARRLLELNMTRKTYTVEAVPVIDTKEIEKTILNKKYKIVGLVVKGYIPNSTKKDGKKIRTIGDPLEKLVRSAKTNLGATVKAEFKGINAKVIEKKEGVVSLINELKTKDNFDVSVSLKDVGDPKKTFTIHSNLGDGSYMDMGLQKIFPGKITDVPMLDSQIDSVEEKELFSLKIDKKEEDEARAILKDSIDIKVVKFERVAK